MVRYEFEIKISQECRLFMWWQFTFLEKTNFGESYCQQKSRQTLAQVLTFCPSRWEVKVPLIVNIENFLFPPARPTFCTMFFWGFETLFETGFIWGFNQSVNKYRVMVMAMVFTNGKCMKTWRIASNCSLDWIVHFEYLEQTIIVADLYT